MTKISAVILCLILVLTSFFLYKKYKIFYIYNDLQCVYTNGTEKFGCKVYKNGSTYILKSKSHTCDHFYSYEPDLKQISSPNQSTDIYLLFGNVLIWKKDQVRGVLVENESPKINAYIKWIDNHVTFSGCNYPNDNFVISHY